MGTSVNWIIPVHGISHFFGEAEGPRNNDRALWLPEGVVNPRQTGIDKSDLTRDAVSSSSGRLRSSTIPLPRLTVATPPLSESPYPPALVWDTADRPAAKGRISRTPPDFGGGGRASYLAKI